MSTQDVSRPPYGLLDFFSLKSLGRAPYILRDDLSGTVDMLQWWLVRPSETIVSRFTNPAPGNVYTTQVPDNETWIIHSFTGNLSLGIGDAATGVRLIFGDPTILGLGTTNDIIDASGAVNGTANAVACLTPMNLNKQPYLIGPGTRLGITSTTISVVAAVQIDVTLRITRLLT